MLAEKGEVYAPACGGKEVPRGPTAGPPIPGRPKKVYAPACGGKEVPWDPTADPPILGRPKKSVSGLRGRAADAGSS